MKLVIRDCEKIFLMEKKSDSDGISFLVEGNNVKIFIDNDEVDFDPLDTLDRPFFQGG